MQRAPLLAALAAGGACRRCAKPTPAEVDAVDAAAAARLPGLERAAGRTSVPRILDRAAERSRRGCPVLRAAGRTRAARPGATAWPKCARRSTSAATTRCRRARGWRRRCCPGPTGERNELRLHGRGVFVCISPWNFPLAIFAGQVVAALVAGNAVAAKPAEQTPGVAHAFVELLHEAGVPADALQLLHGPGETVGAALVAAPALAGVCFTGSTQVAQAHPARTGGEDGPIVPLIAETGGLNAMVVDSTALPEQVVDAVVQSAFRSAGQRCSALRLLCVHESIADAADRDARAARWQELRVGDAARARHRRRPGDRRRGPRQPHAPRAAARAGSASCSRAARSHGLSHARTSRRSRSRSHAIDGADARRSSAPCCTWCADSGDVDAVVDADQRARLRAHARHADAHRQPRAAHRRARARSATSTSTAT